MAITNHERIGKRSDTRRLCACLNSGSFMEKRLDSSFRDPVGSERDICSRVA